MAATLEGGGRPRPPALPLWTATPPIRSRRAWLTVPGALNAAGFALLVLGAAVMLLPIFWMVSTSVKSLADVFTLPIEWWPAQPNWQNYADAWDQNPFGRYFINSTIVATTTAAINVLLSSLAGYALAKYSFFGKQAIFLCILATLMLPIEVLMVPTFLLVKNLNWLDTYQSLIIPGAANAFGVFLMRQTMLHVPDPLMDAARIDGAGEGRIFFQIVMPLVWPAVLTLALLEFRESWDSFVWPLIVISQNSMRTVSIGLSLFQQENMTNYNQLMAMSSVAMLPMLVLFFFFQRSFIQGITSSGIKE
ncbi:MAG: carbohydrate ABC transporter permease [Chloroflexi bacterium]|nr:carbohydrate ABC transporter permease [Chloroflexota bacterium]MBV9597146.1 carbohydrate ABC transporter permease [Chloroflexota bacterium]